MEPAELPEQLELLKSRVPPEPAERLKQPETAEYPEPESLEQPEPFQ